MTKTPRSLVLVRGTARQTTLGPPRSLLGSTLLLPFAALACCGPWGAAPVVPERHIRVRLPEASPERVEKEVLLPLERSLIGAEGLTSLRAEAQPGEARLTLRWANDSAEDAAQLGTRLASASSVLPPAARMRTEATRGTRGWARAFVSPQPLSSDAVEALREALDGAELSPATWRGSSALFARGRSETGDPPPETLRILESRPELRPAPLRGGRPRLGAQLRCEGRGTDACQAAAVSFAAHLMHDALTWREPGRPDVLHALFFGEAPKKARVEGALEALRAKPGLQLLQLRGPSTLRTELRLRGAELEVLLPTLEEIARSLPHDPPLWALRQRPRRVPVLRFVPDEDRLRRFGLTSEAAEAASQEATRAALGSSDAARRWMSVRVRAAHGEIPLRELGSLQQVTSVDEVLRRDGHRVALMSIDGARHSGDETLRVLRSALASTKLPLGVVAEIEQGPSPWPW